MMPSKYLSSLQIITFKYLPWYSSWSIGEISFWRKCFSFLQGWPEAKLWVKMVKFSEGWGGDLQSIWSDMVKYVGYGLFDTPYLKPPAGYPRNISGHPMRREPPSEIRLVPHSAGSVCADTPVIIMTFQMPSHQRRPHFWRIPMIMKTAAGPSPYFHFYPVSFGAIVWLWLYLTK